MPAELRLRLFKDIGVLRCERAKRSEAARWVSCRQRISGVFEGVFDEGTDGRVAVVIDRVEGETVSDNSGKNPR